MIEQALKQMEVLKGDKDEKETRKILEDKKQELLEQAKVVLPEEKFFEEASKDEESIIKELASKSDCVFVGRGADAVLLELISLIIFFGSFILSFSSLLIKLINV